MNTPAIYVYRASDLRADAAALSTAEQTELAVHAFGPRRRREWVRGRVAARKALAQFAGDAAVNASILVHPDGAPRITGCPGIALSLSHDGDYVAVALGRGSSLSVGVDLCLHRHRERARGILRRLAVNAGKTGNAARAACAIDPVVQWVAIETALKLRRLAVTALLDARIAITTPNPAATDSAPSDIRPTIVSETTVVRISGLGGDVDVDVRCEEDYALAWGLER